MIKLVIVLSKLRCILCLLLQIVEQRQDGMWRGCLMKEGCMAKPGWFPADHVVLIDNSGK